MSASEVSRNMMTSDALGAEARWREEERRMREERVGMETLMKQAFGEAGTATGMAELGFAHPHGLGFEYGFGFP